MARERPSEGTRVRADEAVTAPLDIARARRLAELIALAQEYRKWSLRRLSEALGRDPHNLIAPGGNPRMDFLMRLAEVLDWSAQDVCDHVWGSSPVVMEAPHPGDEWR